MKIKGSITEKDLDKIIQAIPEEMEDGSIKEAFFAGMTALATALKVNGEKPISDWEAAMEDMFDLYRIKVIVDKVGSTIIEEAKKAGFEVVTEDD
ncbi:MAG: hypothetical protein HFJ75_07570 [Eggerthellaceae bacterium]|nr:hypothetical protein [Eggerthellaceae bacterium]